MDAYQVTITTLEETKFSHKNNLVSYMFFKLFFLRGLSCQITSNFIDYSLCLSPPQPEAMTLPLCHPYLRCITPGIHTQAERR